MSGEVGSNGDHPTPIDWRTGGGWGCHISWMGKAEPTNVVTRHGLLRRKRQHVRRKVYGHLPLLIGAGPQFPKVGDRLLSEMKSGRTAAFRFIEVEPQRDPDDMFIGTVEDIGYVDKNGSYTP